MQKILRKRVWRNLRENRFRYLALGLLIVLGMYLIVSLVGAAETVISGVDVKAEENRLEDGQFRVFVPLTEQEEKQLRKKGITLEKMFTSTLISRTPVPCVCFRTGSTLT